MSQQPDLDDPDLDGDPGAEHAAYDEWAAIAGEPAPRAAVSLEERPGHAAASGGLAEALLTRKREGARWAEMAVLYRNNFLSRSFEEALMRARIPYHLVGDVGFYA